MQPLQVWNEQVAIRVGRDGRLFCRLTDEEAFAPEAELQEGTLELAELAAASGLLHYAVPCLYESVVVNVEGVAAPAFHRALGQWPEDVDEDQLETYPHLHFLEERKTGTPWRYERWYTLAGPHLVFDSQQYFERPRPRQHGRDWERLIVQLRQVVDLVQWAENPQRPAVNLIVSTL